MSKTFITRITICLLLLWTIITPVTANAITYYVKFNANGGSGTMSNQTFTTDEEKYLTTNAFTRTGYNFIGWNSNTSGTGTWYMPSKKVKNLTTTSGATVNIYAQWINSNQSTIKIGTTEVTKDSGGNYNIDNYKKYTINVVVNNGTVDTSSKTVEYYTDATFTVTPLVTGADGSVECTNSQTASISGTTLTVNNVSNNTTCTVTFNPDKTTLYTDGTLIINEKISDRTANIASHGAVTNEYAPLSNSNAYVFENSTRPWYSERASITAVEIGQKIQPTNTRYWFAFLENMSTGDFSDLDTSGVTNMEDMFIQAGNDSSVTSFSITGLDNWDTSKVTDMGNMFRNTGSKATTWNIGNLSNWDTSKVTDMFYMFYYTGYKTTNWTIGNLSNWDTSNVESMYGMFQYAGYNAVTFNLGNLSNWDTSSVTDMAYMFCYAGYSATTWNIGSLSNWSTSNVTNMSKMFQSAGLKATTFQLDLSSWVTPKATDMTYMFASVGRSATTWSIGNLSNWNTSEVTNMNHMFSDAGYSATTWSIGNLSNWNTSKVTDMGSMFYRAGKDSTTWNSIGVLKTYATKIFNMFYNCEKAQATLNIYSNPNDYTDAFGNAATTSGAKITVNYSSTTTNIDAIIATKGSNSNVVKGVQLN